VRNAYPVARFPSNLPTKKKKPQSHLYSYSFAPNHRNWPTQYSDAGVCGCSAYLSRALVAMDAWHSGATPRALFQNTEVLAHLIASYDRERRAGKCNQWTPVCAVRSAGWRRGADRKAKRQSSTRGWASLNARDELPGTHQGHRPRSRVWRPFPFRGQWDIGWD